MHISQAGLDFIKGYEKYARALPDGSCIAYKPTADDVWTIGWGCTEGVHEGDIWSREKAEVEYAKAIDKKAQGVIKVLKFVPTQSQLDAMISLAYNIGESGFAKSSVLRLANAGDILGASKAFALWNKQKGKVLGGLVTRRAAESAMFLSEVALEEEPMAQTVDAPSEGMGGTAKNLLNNTQQTTAGVGIIGVVLSYLGLMPADVINFVKTYGLEMTLGGCVVLFLISEAFKNFKGDK